MNEFFYDSHFLILFFVIPGLFFGILYDAFRILRLLYENQEGSIVSDLRKHFFPNASDRIQLTPNRKRTERALIIAEDILFCLICALTEVLLFYHLNDGLIRVYGLILSLLGLILYRLTLGRLVLYCAKKLKSAIRRCIYIFFCILLTPWFRIYHKIKNRKKKTGSISKK